MRSIELLRSNVQRSRKRVVYVDAAEHHSRLHDLASTTLGYCAGQAGFFKFCLSLACNADFLSMAEFRRKSKEIKHDSDAIIFSSKSGIRQWDTEKRHEFFRDCNVPVSILVHEARPNFMIENEIADFCSTIFKREPLVDLSRYELSNRNRAKIVPTILANPLNPLFARTPWLHIGTRPRHFSYEQSHEFDAFFIGRVGKNRYENRVATFSALKTIPDIRLVGGILPAEEGFFIPEDIRTDALNRHNYMATMLKSRVNLALRGIGPFTFRHLELLWSGAFCLSDVDLGQIWLREKISAGTDYVFFDGIDDMVDKVRYYAKSDSARDRVARSGRQYYERLYDVDQHAMEIKKALSFS
jgi:glycosyltransferase involved in cell wall biosynthesis